MATQGSLLGVILFGLQINDLKQSVKYGSVILYADDTTIYMLGKSIRCLRTKLQFDLDELSMWLKCNKLLLNVEKTKVMYVDRENLNPKLYLSIDGEQIEQVETFKFLGVTICNNLRFEKHIRLLYTKLQNAMYMSRKCLHILPRSCLLTLYYAYFNSHLTYAISVWGTLCRKQLLDQLYILQKKIVRMITKSNPREHCMPLFKELKILTIFDAINIDLCKNIFKIKMKIAPKVMTMWYQRNPKTRNGLILPKYILGIANNSFLTKSIMLWNSISENIRSCKSLYQLKRMYKMYCLSKILTSTTT